MAEHDIDPIDLVVGNLYPFGSSVADFQHGAGRPEELIDIGGPAMVRAAAKNYAQVGVVVDPSRYDDVLAELRALGSLSDATRRALARDAFAHTAAYDAAIVTWFDETADEPTSRGFGMRSNSTAACRSAISTSSTPMLHGVSPTISASNRRLRS